MKSKNMSKYQIRVLRSSIPKPWREVAMVLIKYAILEGRYIILHASYFFLLNHFIFLNTDKVNFPYFIFNSMVILVNKVKQNRVLVPLHESIIKLVYEEVVANKPKKHPRIKIRVGGRVFQQVLGAQFT